MRLVLAFRAFFATLFNGLTAQRVGEVLRGLPAPVPAAAPTSPAAERPAPKPPSRSEALTLLAALQRETRFVDLVQEPLANYSDAQIGAAARDVLRDCGKVLDRMFGLAAVVQQDEGSAVDLPADYDAGRFRLVGRAAEATAPLRGQLVHHGWEATKCELPTWTGSAAALRIIAPAEVEVGPG